MQQSLFCKKEFRAEITKNDASELQLCWLVGAVALSSLVTSSKCLYECMCVFLSFHTFPYALLFW